ncbi:acyl-CoA synthetase, AMP-forming [Citrifermentans bemidjiense Bem]|uniref:Acyl-CoA synthetase, AMP-forming n=1 Tax=Citrifermentans bemidjiense (strain ATCC BAA-1014 / DSM 16622 / JCM 12645 / Bem) TaxID=404380 RepID=B5EDE2_CITBB|nr:long-chain fatty acid--CoA ligase [Citrifermentans bemidjiense]ACH39138.1 acyl-CoA synthetase, AMP-forming [Citrifermentans bemidjiense Bem]
MEKVPYRSIPDMLRHSAAQYQTLNAVEFRKNGQWVTLSYAQFYNRALMVSRGLRKLRMKPGDRIAILSENRAGWIIADMGILCGGGVTVPVYATGTPDQIAYALSSCEARIVFVSGKVQYRKLLQVRDALPHLEHVISFERFLGEAALPVTTFYQLSEVDDPILDTERAEIDSVIDSLTPEMPATIIYTSGTTGTPKGAVLTHGNLVFDVWATLDKVGGVGQEDLFLSFLPLSHVFERSVGYYLPLSCGAAIAFADSMEKISENMMELHPTIMVCVPRFFEKIYSRIYEAVHQLSLFKRKMFRRALAVGRSYVYARYIDKYVPFWLSFQHAIADRLVFSKLRSRFGDRLKFCASGGAPLDREINEFFWIIGVPVFEGYGLTETSPVLCSNSYNGLRFGSVGTPLAFTEIAIAGDGEVLARGPQVMAGYYNDEAATKEALVDGWFRTGDIGRLEEGFLYITDRKKDLIVTAGGKNIAPQPIENLLKRDKYISQAYVYGDRKPYLTALLVPTLERLLEFAQERRIAYHDLEDLVVHQPVIELYKSRVEAVNNELAPFQTIKKFALLPRDFTMDSGELTPTLKVKRQVISERYRDQIDHLYNGSES